MNVAFDQVTSKKDQEQYWIQNEKPYHYVSVLEFVAKRSEERRVGKEC